MLNHTSRRKYLGRIPVASGRLFGLKVVTIGRIDKNIQMFQSDCSRYSATLPVMYSLSPNISLITKHFRNFCGSAEIINNLRICFHNAHTLNAAFSFVKRDV